MTTIALDKPGSYPIVLSDALLGRSTSAHTYTGVRYNYKPERADADAASSSMRIQPADDDDDDGGGETGTYNLSLRTGEGKYRFQGQRLLGSGNGNGNGASGQYTLIFDPRHKHFVLHRLDSTFEMNLVGAPWSSDAGALRSEFAQIGSSSSSSSVSSPRPSAAAAAVSRGKSTTNNKPAAVEKPARKVKPAPARRSPTPPRAISDEDEDGEADEASDDGLQVEYPGGKPPSRKPPANFFFATPVLHKEVSPPVDTTAGIIHDDTARNVDGDGDGDGDVDVMKLPSPIDAAPGEEEASDGDLEDLEAELEQALQEHDAESDMSEEE